MAETSSAAFDCATKNWNGSQQTATSTLTEILTDFKTTTASNKSSLSNKQNQSIKNGNGVDEQFGINDLIKQKKPLIDSSSTLDDNRISINSSTIKPSRLTDLLATSNQQNSNLSTKKEISNSTPILINELDDNQREETLTPTIQLQQSLRNDNIIFRVGFKLEACDSTGTWYPAKIVAINEEDKQVLIHFIRWSKKFDEWMSMQSDQLRALTKEDDENSEAESQKSFSVGKLVLASWSDNKKYPGHVLNVTSDGNYNILFLDGYRKKVKKSLVEQIPDDYQINFNSPLGKCNFNRLKII